MTMRKRIRGLLPRVAISMLSIGLEAAGALHPPQTQAERALDRIMHVADKDDQVLDNLFHRNPIPAADRVDYGKYLLPALLRSLNDEQLKLVKDDCGGHYRSGELCGMDYNPLTCAQDDVTPQTYSTTAQTSDSAVIIDSRSDVYTMVRLQSVWKLGSVACKF